MIDIFFHDKTGVVSGFPGQIDGFEYADGNGEIHYYRLFDGVGIMLLRLEMEAYTEIRTQIGRLEVNFLSLIHIWNDGSDKQVEH